MEHSHFDPSSLQKGASLRESLRHKEAFSPERLDRAHDILQDALAKHGEGTLTKKNFEKVTEHMRKDPRWHGLYSGGDAFESHLKSHLGIEDEAA